MHRQLEDIYAILAGSNTQAMQQTGLVGFVFLMTVSLVTSLFIAFLYTRFYSSRATGSQVHRAFPLLGISITAIFICIQFSLPLSLGLLGALSIVRFRTPIKEPEEIGFIMLVIAASIATATFKLAFVGIICGMAVVAVLAQSFARRLGHSSMDGVIVISVPEHDQLATPAAVTELLNKRLSHARLDSVSRNDSHVVLSYNFEGITQKALAALQADLTAAAGTSTFNIFFNRAGAL